METKICSYCGEEKDLTFFRFSGNRYRGECKQCEGIKHKLYVEKNREKVNKKNRETYYQNKQDRNTKQREYRDKHREKITKANKEYYLTHKEYFKEKHRKYSIEHRNEIRENDKKWRKNNIIKVKEIQKRSSIKRREDPKLRLECNIRNMISSAFRKKRFKKSKKLEEICQCNINELVEYLIKTYENNYNEQWSWEYLNNIHIDHITPLATAKTEEDVIMLNIYTNLQLLKKEDNLEKGAKLDWYLQ